MRLNVGPDKYLLCNQFSGAVTLVDARWWDNLGLDGGVHHDHTQAVPLFTNAVEYAEALVSRGAASPEEAAELIKHSYILTADARKTSEQKIRDFAQLKRKTRVTMVYFTPTINCPLACVYCFETHDRNSVTKARLLPSDLPAVENLLTTYIECKGLEPEKISLVLFGGEPLIPSLKAFNRAIFGLARRRGYFLDVVTSGAYLDSYYIDLFNEHRDILREIDITIDGPESTHNALRPWKGGKPTYSNIIRNVDLLLSNDHRVMVKTNFGRHTINVVDQLLDSIRDLGWFESPQFLFTTNIIRSFGMTETNGEELTEDVSILKIIELFQHSQYRALLPRVRIESLKITDYLSNALEVLTFQQEGGVLQNMFDAYPKYAFCHPDDGTMFNVAYDGSIYTCNWAAGKRRLTVGNMFDESAVKFCNSAYKYPPVVDKPFCQNCDLNTFCGGGCPIDKAESDLDEFHASCREHHYKTLDGYIENGLARGLFSLELNGSRMRTYREQFDFDYRYESRTTRRPPQTARQIARQH